MQFLECKVKVEQTVADIVIVDTYLLAVRSQVSLCKPTLSIVQASHVTRVTVYLCSMEATT